MNGASANTFSTTEQAVAGILDLLRKGQVEPAVAAYTRYQEDIGFPLLSRVAGDIALQKAVANLFYRARDYPKAAMCCENLGENEKAAALYEKCEDYEMAAEMQSKLGNPLRSAEMFDKAKKYGQAAELFMKAGDAARAASSFEKALNHYHAGKLYFQMNRLQKSMELLQKVKKEEDEFIEAALLISEILEKNNHLDLAIRKLLSVKTASELDQKNATIFYELADLYAKKGMKADAQKLFSDLATWDFNYRDAAARLADLDRGGSGLGSSAAAADRSAPPATELPDAPVAASNQIVSVMEGFEYLKQLPLFEELALAEMKAFYTLCEKRQFKAGDVLIEQGTPGKALFILTHGAFEVKKATAGRPAITVAALGPGSYVGDMSMIDDAPTSAQVSAKDAGAALVIAKEAFTRFLSTNDHLAMRIYRVFVRTMADRLRKTTEQMSSTAAGA